MERASSYLKMLLDVIKTITSSLDLDQVLRLIVERIPEVVSVDAATIRLLDASGKKLVLQAASGLSDAYLKRGPVDFEPGVMEALQGTAIFIPDATSDSRISYHDAAKEEGIRSVLVAPIPIRGKINGVLRLLSRTYRQFGQEEIEFAVALAEQCGIAIENARSYDEQKKQIGYLKAVCEISKSINASRDLSQILNLIVKRLPEIMKLKACTIRLFEPSHGRLELKAAYGLSQTYLERGPLDEELSTHYILQGEPVVIPDATVDLHTIYHKEAVSEGVGSILAVPITVKDETIGMLRLLTGEVRFFSDADINFAMTVAEQAGSAIQNTIGIQKENS